MTVQRGMYPSADASKAFSPSNIPGVLALSKGCRLTLRWAALIAAITVLIAAGGLEPASLEAYPPPKAPSKGPSPQDMQKMQDQQRKMLQELLKQQQQRHQLEKKQREEYQKQLQKKLQEQQKPHEHMQKQLAEEMKKHPLEAKGAPPPPKTKGAPHLPGMKASPHLQVPIPTPQQLPRRKEICHALRSASNHVHTAVKFAPGPKMMALESIGVAVSFLGEVLPPPTLLAQKGNHLLWAKEDLQRAHRDVIGARHLPPQVKAPVLEEIHKAMYFLDHPEMPYPDMRRARLELVDALHHVHAAEGLEVKVRNMAVTNIREALHVLGHVSPDPGAPRQRGNHIRLAEEHLHTAYLDVIEARRLPPQQRIPALREIHNAIFALRHPAEKFPDLKEAKNQLVYALHQVHATKIRADLKELAVNSIGDAISILGEVPPGRWERYQPADHLKRAEEHLHKAREDLEPKRHLPQREFALEMVKIADIALKDAANLGGGGASK